MLHAKAGTGCGLCGVGLLFWAGIALAGETAWPEKGPFLQVPELAAGKVTICWETAAETEGAVEYGLAAKYDLKATDGAKSKRHEVTLPGLKAGEEYAYRIVPPGGDVGGRFRLPQAEQERFRFVIIGDPRAYDAAAKELIPQLIADKPDFLLGTGDYVHTGKGPTANWVQCFQVLRPILRNTPFLPAIGDHETGNDKAGEAFRANFALPGNELWYSFDWGRCHFVALRVDWEESCKPETEQVQWLEKDLAAVAGKRDFICAYFHHPVYTCGNYAKDPDNTLRGQRLKPVFEKYGVAATFAGHDHNYQRWEVGPMTHLVIGGFTVERLYDITEAAKKPETKAALKEPHYVLVDIQGPKAEFVVKGLKNKELDRFSLQKKTAVK
jgi:hypothetical protein